MAAWDDIRDGLVTVVQTVTALKKVLTYEPETVSAHPIAWVLLDSYTRNSAGQVTSMRYRFLVRVATPYQSRAQAEDEVVAAALSVADAIDTNPQFTGTIVSGIARSEDGQAGWLTVGGVPCRVVDVFCTAIDKFAYKGAI